MKHHCICTWPFFQLWSSSLSHLTGLMQGGFDHSVTSSNLVFMHAYSNHMFSGFQRICFPKPCKTCLLTDSARPVCSSRTQCVSVARTPHLSMSRGLFSRSFVFWWCHLRHFPLLCDPSESVSPTKSRLHLLHKALCLAWRSFSPGLFPSPFTGTKRDMLNWSTRSIEIKDISEIGDDTEQALSFRVARSTLLARIGHWGWLEVFSSI